MKILQKSVLLHEVELSSYFFTLINALILKVQFKKYFNETYLSKSSNTAHLYFFLNALPVCLCVCIFKTYIPLWYISFCLLLGQNLLVNPSQIPKQSSDTLKTVRIAMSFP